MSIVFVSIFQKLIDIIFFFYYHRSEITMIFASIFSKSRRLNEIKYFNTRFRFYSGSNVMYFLTKFQPFKVFYEKVINDFLIIKLFILYLEKKNSRENGIR